MNETMCKQKEIDCIDNYAVYFAVLLSHFVCENALLFDGYMA